MIHFANSSDNKILLQKNTLFKVLQLVKGSAITAWPVTWNRIRKLKRLMSLKKLIMLKTEKFGTIKCLKHKLL